MGEKITKEQARAGVIDVTDFRKRYIIRRGNDSKVVGVTVPWPKGVQNPLVKELENADRVRN